MPTLGNSLDFSKYEARNIRAHQLGTAPAAPVTGQFYYNTADNTLYWWDGTSWVSSRGGAAAVPPATTTVQGTIMLAGDLTGTATSPQIAAGVITDADVNAANKDGAKTTPSLRTIGAGAQQAMAGNMTLDAIYPPVSPVVINNQRLAQVSDPAAPTDGANKRYVDSAPPTAHHTTHEPGGSDPLTVDAAVGTGSLRTLGLTALKAMPGDTKLNAITAPNNDVSLNGWKLTNVLGPVGLLDAANKQYVDNIATGLDVKASVRVASLANINVNNPGTAVFDGITLNIADRILVKDQTSKPENGLYGFNGSGNPLFRTSDADQSAEVTAGLYVWVEEGTQQDTGWVLTTDNPITLNTTPLTFVQFAAAGQITGGAGLTKTGNTIDVGAGPGITVNADTIQVANDGITNAMIADGAINLAGADVTGTLPITKGGTGRATAGNNSSIRVGASSYTAKSGDFIVTNSSNSTISLPATPIVGDEVTVVNTSSTVTTILAASIRVYGGSSSNFKLPAGASQTFTYDSANAWTLWANTGHFYSDRWPVTSVATWTIPQTVHGLWPNNPMAVIVQVQDATTGAIEIPDVTVNASSDVTITYGVAVAINAKLVSLSC
jgi:hypothetical protein